MFDVASRLHKEDVEAVVGSVFDTMMGLGIWPSDAPCPASDGLLTAAVYLTGEWEGAVCVHCAPSEACEFTGRFVGSPPPETVDNDVRDVMGELANMIAGSLKCTFAPGIRVSIPSVTDGADYSVRFCTGHLASETAFHTNAGPVWISLIDKGEA